MNIKQIRPSVLYLASGAIIGAIAGALFERSPFIQMFYGSSSCMVAPGMPGSCGDAHPLTGMFICTGGIVFGAVGGIAGIIKEGMTAHRKLTKLAIGVAVAIAVLLLMTKH